jgi:hypothetical protein
MASAGSRWDIRVSSVAQNHARHLDSVELDRVLTDTVSGWL